MLSGGLSLTLRPGLRDAFPRDRSAARCLCPYRDHLVGADLRAGRLRSGGRACGGAEVAWFGVEIGHRGRIPTWFGEKSSIFPLIAPEIDLIRVSARFGSPAATTIQFDPHTSRIGSS